MAFDSSFKNKVTEAVNSAPNNELSEDDVYSLAIEMKSFPRNLVDWKELASLVHWDGSGESLRKWVGRKSIKESTKIKTSEDSLISQDDEVKKIQLRDEWTAYRRSLREDARVEEFKNSIIEAIGNLDKLPKCEYHKSVANDSKEAILLISDLHIGVECDNFYNKYNVEIARKRINKLVDDAIDYCARNNVGKLNVVNLGDCVQGIIHTNARIEQQIDVTQQIIYAGEILADALNKLQEACPCVVYRSCTDNHSRAIADKNEAIEEENFFRIIDWYLEERLKSSKIIFAKDNIDFGIGKFTLNNGKKVMFSHGHNDSINAVYQHFTGASREYIDYILLGHYHCEKVKSYQNTRVIVNGSIVGTEQYALSKRLFSEPSQLLLIFDKDNCINISINLNIR